MSTNHTDHYSLSLWEPEDQVQRTEFNENHAKIDAALAGLQVGQLRIHTGFYIGTGKSTLTLELPFRPMFLWIYQGTGFPEQLVMMGEKCSILAALDNNLLGGVMNGNHFTAAWSGNTLNIEGSVSANVTGRYAMNINSYHYMYLAVG